jgi:ketosteroid isomerase-like protein
MWWGNARKVRRMVEAWTRGDLEAAREFLDPRVRYPVLPKPKATTHRDESRRSVEEVIGAGDQVISVIRERGPGERIGLDLVFETTIVWTCWRGWIVAAQIYETKYDALVAVGLLV